MVLSNSLQSALADLCKTSTFNLPTYKENHLDISYCNKSSTTKSTSNVYSGSKPILPFAASDVCQANISAWRRLTAKDENCKAVYEVTLNVTGSYYKFEPGDTIGVIPKNETEEVNEIVKHLNIGSQVDLEYSLSISNGSKGCKIPAHVPVKSTLRHVLTYCCDIRGVLKKLFILALSKYTKDESERRILEYLCSKEGSVAYTTHILNKRFSLLDLFYNFKSCLPPVQILLAHLPRLLPRPYSIVNRNCDDNTVKICFSVIDISGDKRGLVSGQLEKYILKRNTSLDEHMKSMTLDSNKTELSIYFRKNMSGFSMPEDSRIPMILIGPGTGISPFIGFLEERQRMKEIFPDNEYGKVFVFFGCRHPELDFIYRKELKEFVDDGTVTELMASFSRMGCDENKYIQDNLLLHGEDVVKLINDGASIFVCGDLNKIEKHIKDALVQCMMKFDDKTLEEAEKTLSDMKTTKRYLIDSWS